MGQPSEKDQDEYLIERRRPDPTIVCLTQLIQSIENLHGKIEPIADMQKALNDHVEREEKLFVSAFPDGDPDGHRRAHEAQIKAAEKRAEFWERMSLKAGELTVYGFLICLIAVAAYYWNGHMPASAQINLPGAK